MRGRNGTYGRKLKFCIVLHGENPSPVNILNISLKSMYSGCKDIVVQSHPFKA